MKKTSKARKAARKTSKHTAKRAAKKASKKPAKKASKKASKKPAKSAGAGGPPQLPPPMQMMQLLMGFMVSKAISAAAKLNVADQLVDGPKYYTDIALATGADRKALHRLLRALTSVGVFAEPKPGTFALTPLSELLVGNRPGSLRDMADMVTTPSHWLPWGRFEESIRKGVSVAEEVFGKPLWDYFRDNEEEGRIFNAAMTSFSDMTAAAVAQAYDFKRFSRIVDVGGGHGLLLATLLTSAPGTRGVLYDLPQVTKDAGPLLRGVAGRYEVVDGSFFDAVPEGGDCYVLKHIIHDWDDDRCVRILANIRKAMKPGARVLVLDAVMPEDPRPDPAFMMDINMLAMTPGGCERTQAQFAELFNRAGLRLHGVTLTQSPVAIVEAVAA